MRARRVKMSGHDNYQTFLKYITINADLARDLSQEMNERRARMEARAAQG